MGAPKGNKYAVGNNGGRPPMYSNVEEFDNEVNDYFDIWIKGEKGEEEFNVEIDGNNKTLKREVWIRDPEPPTITGLALYLGFANRKALFDYGLKDEFSNSVKRAKARVENSYEKNLYNNGSAGSIFALKNFGWKDERSIDHTTQGEKINNSTILTDLSESTLKELAEKLNTNTESSKPNK